MALRHISTQQPWNPKERINGVRYPRSITSWTDEQLAEIGLERIPKPAPEPVDPLSQPLTQIQFHAMIAIAGKTEAIDAAIDAMENANERAVATARLKHTHLFHRDDPLFSTLAPAVGLTSEQIDALWVQALGITF